METNNCLYQNININKYLDVGTKYWIDNANLDKCSLNYISELVKEEDIINGKEFVLQINNSVLSKQMDEIFFYTRLEYIHNNSPIQFIDIHKMNRVGIDRIKLYVKVNAVDFEKCNARIEGFINENSCKRYEIIDINTGEVKEISSFSFFSTIENKYDKGKSIVRYGLSIDKKQCNLNFILDITTPNSFYNKPTPYNLSHRDLSILIENIRKELQEEGIYIEFNDSNVFYLELNKNIVSTTPLYRKHNTLKYLSENVFKDKSSLDPPIQLESEKSKTFTIADNRISIVIYDKSCELNNKYSVNLNKSFSGLEKDSSIYRVEIKFKNTESIIRAFRTNNLSKLSNLEFIVEDKFHAILDKKLIRRIQEYINEEYKYLYNLIEYGKFKHIREVYAKNQSRIFDISIFAKAMFEKYKELNNSSNFSKDFKKLMNNYTEDIKFKELEELEELIDLITNNKISLIDIPKNIKKQIHKYCEVNNIK